MQTFWRCIFNMPHVEVEPAAVEQKTAVAWGFFVIAIVQIDRSDGSLAKEIVLHVRWPNLGVEMRLVVADQAPIFGFDADNSIHLSNHPPALRPGQGRMSRPSAARLKEPGKTRKFYAQ